MRRFPSARILELGEMSCVFVCADPVTVDAIEDEMEAPPPIERVELIPKVAVAMYRHKGQVEMANQVPTDRQLVEMTRIGSYYGIGYEEGPPTDVQLRIEWNKQIGKISALPYEGSSG